MDQDIVEVTSERELRDIVGEPNARAAAKERSRLSDMDKRWLRASPFCLVATADATGACDVSPKGDPPGFTHVLDDTTIALPERPGNKRVDGFGNILSNPRVGLLYVVPGRGDTLRINGRARLVSQAPFFDEMIVKGHRPRLALLVHIETIFFHCAKAFMRSRLWDGDSWDPTALPPTAEIVKAVQPDTAESLDELRRHYRASNYETKLYDS